MVGLSTKKSPLAGMGFAQKIATIVLAVLALVALVAVLAHGGSSASPASDHSTGSTATAGGPPSNGSDTTSTTRHGASRGTSSSGAAGSTAGADGLATTTVDQLPPQAAATLKLIDAGGPFPYSRDGVVFSNREGMLPKHPRGWYHEYTVKTPGESDRGTRRLIKGQDGSIYYTGDHYVTFKRVTR